MKRKMKMKTVSAALVVMMTASVMTGCGTKKAESADSTSVKETQADTKAAQSEEPVNLKVMLLGNAMPDLPKVSAAVSEITKEKINATVEFSSMSSAEFNEKLPMMIASGDQMDISFISGGKGYVDYARDGVFVDIKEMLDLVPELKEAIDPLLWEGAAVDGGIYAVPTQKEMAETWQLLAETTFLEENSIDPSTITTMKDAEVILEALAKDENRAGYMITKQAGHENLAKWVNYAPATAKAPVFAVVDKKDAKTVSNWYETEDYKEFIRLMRDWYQKGYIDKDVAIIDNYDEYTQNAVGKYGLFYISNNPQGEVAASLIYGAPLTNIMITNPTVYNGSVTGSMYGIYSNCKDPETALKFLALWNTDPKIKNLITFGIEGVHYVLEDGKVVRTAEQKALYNYANWCSGNIYIAHLEKGETDDKIKEYKEFNSAAVPGLTLGFNPDLNSISSKIAACTAVINEYDSLLCVGAVDPETEYPKFIQALKKSGVDDVINEIQKQYTEWTQTK